MQEPIPPNGYRFHRTAPVLTLEKGSDNGVHYQVKKYGIHQKKIIHISPLWS